jgi:mono/diheme cytochrome c family protein
LDAKEDSVKGCGKYLVVCFLAAFMVAPAFAQEDGAAIYKSKCARCHGDDGMSHTFDGKMSHAAVFSDPEIVKMQDSDLTAVIKNGKKHMPAFGKKLSDDQIASVLAYVHTLQKQPTN